MRALILGALASTVIAACGAASSPGPSVPAVEVAVDGGEGDVGSTRESVGRVASGSETVRSGSWLDAAPGADDASSRAAAPSLVANGPQTEADQSATRSSMICNEQPPQDFLIRGNFLKAGPKGNERAIQYRTEQYGYFKGFGHPAPDAKPPGASVDGTTFMGLSVRMHRKVIPALKCVEEDIRLSCVDHPYTPHALAGIRYRNTYRGGEVTNHAYGIAIDIDPSINTCCGCVAPWNDAPACKRQSKTEYGRMAMPECWVHAFERYGFYWLGHDVLRDTMHFEFLGDPARIVKSDGRGQDAGADHFLDTSP